MARHRFVLVLVGALAAAWSLPAPVTGESLAEIARRERERRERIKKDSAEAGKTITEDELKDGGKRRRVANPDDASAAAPDASSESSPSGSESGAAAAEERTSVQQHWQERIASARDAVKSAEARLKVAEAAARPPAAVDPNYERAMEAEAERRQRAEEAAAVRRELEEARRALADVEAEARQAGVSGGT